MAVDPHTVRAALGEIVLPGRPYPHPLPWDLEAWHVYTADGGHAILCAVEGWHGVPITADDIMPVPVRTVLRGWWGIRDGVPVTDAEYDPELGLIVAEDDEEF